jgi:hypothetical protein
MISGNANAVPEPFVALWRTWQAGDTMAAAGAQRQIDAVRTAFANGARLADFKAALVERGVRTSPAGGGRERDAGWTARAWSDSGVAFAGNAYHVVPKDLNDTLGPVW